MQVDLVIRGGTVVDGSGAAAFEGDVAIADGRIVAVGKLDASVTDGIEEIDARGKLVTPGFVDIHTHYDGQATWDSRLWPSSLHGVTSVVMGNCGVGFAPCKPEDHGRLIELMEGVEDIPGAALHEGLPWNWEGFPGYLDALEERAHDVHIGTQVAHGPLRVYAMGERGANREPANEGDIARMSGLLEESLRAGALGFTTSRTVVHRTRAGDYTPTLGAEEAELVGIAHGVKAAGAGVLELISDFTDFDAEFDRAERMVQTAGCPMTLSLIQSDTAPDLWRQLLARIEDAQSRGLDIRGQVFGRPIGLLMGLRTTIHPFRNHPGYKDIARRPLAERVEAMRDPERRRRILSEQPVRPQPIIRIFGQRWDKMFPFADPLDYVPAQQQSFEQQAARQGIAPAELVYDWLTSDEGRALLYIPLHNYTEFNEANIRTMLEHPNTLFGLSDGGAHVQSICDGGISTYMLTHWCRDAAESDRFALEWTVHKLTRQPAEAVGLLDRGLLAPGHRADINVIDYDNLRLHSPELVEDLPAGGARFVQQASGYTATLVDGQVTYRDGEPTDALPGKIIRGAQPSP